MSKKKFKKVSIHKIKPFVMIGPHPPLTCLEVIHEQLNKNDCYKQNYPNDHVFYIQKKYFNAFFV